MGTWCIFWGNTSKVKVTGSLNAEVIVYLLYFIPFFGKLSAHSQSLFSVNLCRVMSVFACTVTGCGDYEAPPGAVATRTRDRVSIECSSGAQWELRCELGRWVGRTYNCSDAEWTQAWTIGRLINSSGNFSTRANLYLLDDLFRCRHHHHHHVCFPRYFLPTCFPQKQA